MTTKSLSTSTKIANLEKVKSQRVAKIEEDIAAQLSPLLAKRKDENSKNLGRRDFTSFERGFKTHPSNSI